jgi:hypothetical protein
MSYNSNSVTNRDIHNRYKGENVNGQIKAITDTSTDGMNQLFAEFPATAMVFKILTSPFVFVVTAIVILFKTVLRVPARFFFLAFVVDYLLYKPLTYFFEEYLNRNCPILFDSHFLAHVGAESLGGNFPIDNPITAYLAAMVGSVTAWTNFGSHLDQGLSLFVLFFATVPWYFGKSVLLGRPALRIYIVLNLLCSAHLIYMGHLLPTLKGNLSTDGAAFLVTCFVSLAICLVAYILNPVLNKAFSVNNLNALGESHGGLVDTLTADNNLKTPIQS